MIKGFRDFILRGNVIDLAVAVVIGTAFTAVVTAFGTNFIQPLVNAVFSLLGIGQDGIGGTIGLPGEQQINIGAMVTAIINFLITAVVVYFFFVAPMNAAKARLAKPTEEEAPDDVLLLREIRDLLARDGGNGLPPGRDGSDEPSI
jgi:large conductance mechanosensitive channel